MDIKPTNLDILQTYQNGWICLSFHSYSHFNETHTRKVNNQTPPWYFFFMPFELSY